MDDKSQDQQGQELCTAAFIASVIVTFNTCNRSTLGKKKFLKHKSYGWEAEETE